tara:strand:+ start:68 stop:244 length:177 start_codon:yes stop_codon:yes gene_type:complete
MAITDENGFRECEYDCDYRTEGQQANEYLKGSMRKIGQQNARAEHQENPENGVALPNH